MIDEFKTVKNISEGFYSEKRSKFLAFAHHVETVEDIKEILAGYRKKYYDARHVCYAYMLGAAREDFRANDDGEPSSTAGKPILGQINSNELTDILIVVVRYYGGVNLGTSGLIVAYREAAADAPPSPVPTTITSSFLLLLGLTRLTSDLRLVHFSARGPAGIFEINLSGI